jgi:hypothetical protein
MSKSKSSSASAPATVWGDQSPYLNQMYEQAGGMAQAPESASTLQGRGMASQYAQGGMGDIVGQTQGAWQNQLNPQQNPYLQQAMQTAINPLTQAYQENVLSGITDQAMSAGQQGGSRQGIAEGIAGREYLRQVGDIGNQMAFQDYTGGQQRQAAAVGQGGAMANLGMMPSQTMQQIGAQEEHAPWLNLQRMQGIIGGPTVLGGSQSSSSTGGTSSALGGIF